jgi:hypothetical protein
VVVAVAAVEHCSQICRGARVTDSHPPDDTPVLAYSAPLARSGRPLLGTVVAVLAVVAGFFGAVMMFYGISGVPYVFFHDNSVDFPGDLFELIMFLLIGMFCLYVAVRWCRMVPRIISGGH